MHYGLLSVNTDPQHSHAHVLFWYISNRFESFVRMDFKRRARLLLTEVRLPSSGLLPSSQPHSITHLGLLGFIALLSFWQVYVGAGVSHPEQPVALNVPGESWLQLVSLALAHTGTWVLTVLWKTEVNNLFGFLILEDNSMCIKSDSVCSLKAKIAPDGLLCAKWDL